MYCPPRKALYGPFSRWYIVGKGRQVEKRLSGSGTATNTHHSKSAHSSIADTKTDVTQQQLVQQYKW